MRTKLGSHSHIPARVGQVGCPVPQTAGRISLGEDHSAVLQSWTGAHGFRLGAGPGSGGGHGGFQCWGTGVTLYTIVGQLGLGGDAGSLGLPWTHLRSGTSVSLIVVKWVSPCVVVARGRRRGPLCRLWAAEGVAVAVVGRGVDLDAGGTAGHLVEVQGVDVASRL